MHAVVRNYLCPWVPWASDNQDKKSWHKHPRKTYKYPEGDLYSFFCWNGTDLAHHSHARAMSTHTWNMAHGNDGIRIWALDLGVSTFLRVCFFYLIFAFPVSLIRSIPPYCA